MSKRRTGGTRFKSEGRKFGRGILNAVKRVALTLPGIWPTPNGSLPPVNQILLTGGIGGDGGFATTPVPILRYSPNLFQPQLEIAASGNVERMFNIRGRIMVDFTPAPSTPQLSAVINCVVGLRIDEFDDVTTNFSASNPTLIGQACEEEWSYLESRGVLFNWSPGLGLGANVLERDPLTSRFGVPVNCNIGPGEQLTLYLSLCNPNPVNVAVALNSRLTVGVLQ